MANEKEVLDRMNKISLAITGQLERIEILLDKVASSNSDILDETKKLVSIARRG